MAAPQLEDFELIKVLGKGSYGKVMMVTHKRDGGIFAMKMLRKENIVKRNQVQHTQTERRVLESVSHPFLVSLHYAFQTQKKLYMVLEFCPGGELFFHLSRAGRFSEARARFYTAETTLAIGYLHSLHIIYRDLKPENLLLDADGHCKVTDFGLSKEGIEDNVSAKTMCGTPEYLAPEILNKQGHGKAVDWYSIGALTYEMLTGLPPFYTRDREKLFRNIRSGELAYPPYLSSDAKDLLMNMLCRDPERRLGGYDGGAEGIRHVKFHRWFATCDWQAFEQRRVQPPFVPNLDEGQMAKYFDKEFVNQPVVNSEVAEGAVTRDGYHFDNFTYHGNKQVGVAQGYPAGR